MASIQAITIIYNPNSTGDGEKNAKLLKKELGARYDVRLTPTKYAGHAEEIARSIAAEGEPHIVLSSSGDGGYNEVINGVLKNKKRDHIVTGVIPSGNANDHFQALSKDVSLVERIKNQDFTTIDVLELQTEELYRYAHSYIGFGVTPHVGEKLTEATLNPINEIWIVIKNLFTVRPVKVVWHGRTERYDNLLFSNVKKMSKVMKLAETASMHDGKFEITANKSRSVAGLLKHLLQASTIGLNTTKQAQSVDFTLLRATKVQLDGEVVHLPRKSEVTIKVKPRALRCVA